MGNAKVAFFGMGPGGGGTRYIRGWGGAARPLIPLPCLRQTEFRFLIPCLSQRKSILINIRACKNFAVYRPRKDILFKTKIDKSIP